MTYEHIMSALRGWYPRWAAAMRSFHGVRWYVAFIVAAVAGRRSWRNK